MTARLPKVLCLDLGGVVVRICRSFEDACRAAGIEPRPASSPECDETRAAREEAVDKLHRGEISFDAFVTAIDSALGGLYSKEEITRAHDSLILGDYPGVRELLETTKARGIAIACLSNTNDRHWRQMEATSPAFAAIDHRYASHLFGLTKPDEAIFTAFERAMECDPHEILFVDDLPENVMAARAGGWHASIIDHAGDPAAQISRALACFSRMPTSTMPSPLASATVTRVKGVGGIIKERPGDFLVDELPLYEPSGLGEHLFIGVHKVDMAHDELLRIVARHYGVDLGAIGHAGIKDRRAETRQTLSINIPHGEPAVALVHDRLIVLWSRRHQSKLRRGHLAGNRFVIRVRGVDPLTAPTVLRRLRVLESSGVPNGFGSQRFGMRLNNHRLGRLALEERWDELVCELTGAGDLPCPDYQREAREACDRGEWGRSVPLWGAQDNAERKVALALSRGWTPSRAVKSLGGELLRFWITALQSAVFNGVLDDRIANGSLGSLACGDVAFKHESGGCFVVGESDLEDANARAAAMELSPTGPLLGAKLLEGSSRVREAEQRAAERFGVSLATFADAPFPPPGARRPLRIPLANASIDAGVDEFGGFVRAVFDLPPGSFATTVLRELFGELRVGRATDESNQDSSSSSSSSSAASSSSSSSDDSIAGGGAP